MKNYFLTISLLLLSYKSFSQQTSVQTYQTSENYIDTKGKISNIDVLPKFKNNEMFIDDMKYAAKKVKRKWTPATKNGIPVDSKLVIKMNFTNNVYDHD